MNSVLEGAVRNGPREVGVGAGADPDFFLLKDSCLVEGDMPS